MDTNFNNGLNSFTFHEADNDRRVLNEINSSFKVMTSRMVSGTKLNTEDVAKFYLEKTLANQSEPLKNFNKPTSSVGNKIGFRPIQTEKMPFTENQNVKFRQTVNEISVYGSVVNVELDKDLNLVSINSSMLPNIEANTIAKISAQEALQKATEYIQNDIPASIIPLLYLYFFESKWKLVYVVKNVVTNRKTDIPHQHKNEVHKHSFINYVSVIVDAETGAILKESPRAMSLTPSAMSLTTRAKGDDGVEYEISIRDNAGSLEMVDDEYNVITYDLNFTDYNIDGHLPGAVIVQENNSWLSPGVNAHYNACTVARFLKDVLKRNGIDNRGMSLVSTVRCVNKDGQYNWNNAAWLPGLNQMVYGQTDSHGQLKSLAIALDVVGHEILHGVTEFTSNLDYENQPGALNESYSDIFGTIISNYNKNRNQWNWELGEDVSGVPFRDLSNPPKFGQPEHMNEYQNLPNNYEGDWGGVHTNSGIHNKAAYNLITSQGATNDYVFSVNECAVLYYMGLVQLSNTSGFTDNYRSILNAATSLYKNDPAKQAKIQTIQNAFNSVGIQ